MASDVHDACWRRPAELASDARRQTSIWPLVFIFSFFAKDEEEEVGGAVAEVGRAM